MFRIFIRIKCHIEADKYIFVYNYALYISHKIDRE